MTLLKKCAIHKKGERKKSEFLFVVVVVVVFPHAHIHTCVRSTGVTAPFSSPNRKLYLERFLTSSRLVVASAG